MTSIFTDKTTVPAIGDLKKALGGTYKLWKEIEDFTTKAYPAAVAEWNYSGAKYGWSYRIKDKKRAIVYLLPRDGFFKVALVFGQAAFQEIMDSNIADAIKAELNNARPYAEGRGIRLEIKDDSLLKYIKALVKIKLAH